MNASTGLRFLRPCLFAEVSSFQRSAYVRFYHSTSGLPRARRVAKKALKIKTGAQRLPASDVHAENVQFAPSYEVEQRIEELEGSRALDYPRIANRRSVSNTILSVTEYRNDFEQLRQERPARVLTVRGRVSSVRIAGKALIFLDIVQNGDQIQGVCNLEKFEGFAGESPEEFRRFSHLIRRGDIISMTGRPYISKSGEVSLHACDLPVILSPSLASLPKTLLDPQTRIRNRHVDLLVNKKVAHTLRVRSHIIQFIRDFLLKDDFLEVQTPIIADQAGGAVARPFTTVATEFNKELTMRIAPEIWLKRMILGGMDRVFEIGPAFRNEGLDATHNPEFTTCEFYKSFASLEDLISMTEQIVSGLAQHVTSLRISSLTALPAVEAALLTTQFKRLEFIPSIEAGLGEKLPDLAVTDAAEQLLGLFAVHNIPAPSSPTLPRLLDKLSAIYIEPQCKEPTFIVHHPACMAPLAKSFVDQATNQEVSARAELFIQHREIANMYEEENSPFEQRKKFVQQALYRDDENRAVIDESYLEALEWGLPPTGGWGCGIDRLVMLLSGANRISDVLSFGSLKNVVNLGKSGGWEEEGGKP